MRRAQGNVAALGTTQSRNDLSGPKAATSGTWMEKIKRIAQIFRRSPLPIHAFRISRLAHLSPVTPASLNKNHNFYNFN